MTKPKEWRKYLFLALFLLSLLLLPTLFVEKMRSTFRPLLLPFWKSSSLFSFSSEREEWEKKIKRLEIENHLLRLELSKMKSFKEHAPLLPTFVKPLTARVIYRDFNHWMSLFWIDVGRGSKVVKNSPVVIGNKLVGLIDYVGEKQSRVRLVTDAGLKIPVRVQRGEKVNLARGIVQGGAIGQGKLALLLKGSGFTNEGAQELMMKGDLLVTTGVDGIFPEGLVVGRVLKVMPQKEGSYSFDLEALCEASSLPTLKTVYVIPQVGFDQMDKI